MGQQTPRPQIFEPFLQRPDAALDILVRTRAEPAAFVASLRRAVWSADKDRGLNRTFRSRVTRIEYRVSSFEFRYSLSAAGGFLRSAAYSGFLLIFRKSGS